MEFGWAKAHFRHAYQLAQDVTGLWGLASLCAPHGFERRYLPPFHSLVRLAISADAASRMADGVREKRGAGAGCVTPWRSTKIFRAAMCGCLGASLMVRTGAK